MEKVFKEEVEIKNVDMEVVEEVLEVDKKEAEPPTTNEKLLSLVDQPKELKTINLLDPSNDMYPEKVDTQPVIKSTTLSKKEDLTTLLDKYKKGIGWTISVIKGLSPTWFPRKKKVKYKISVPLMEMAKSLVSWRAPHTLIDAYLGVMSSQRL